MRYRLQLVEISTGKSIQEWVLGLPAVVGRSPDADVSIGDDSISRTHCEFFLSPAGALLVRDLKSMNGTIVDGKNVSKTTLAPGSIIQIGLITLKIEWTEDELTDKGPYGQANVKSTQPMRTVTKYEIG